MAPEKKKKREGGRRVLHSCDLFIVLKLENGAITSFAYGENKCGDETERSSANDCQGDEVLDRDARLESGLRPLSHGLVFLPLVSPPKGSPPPRHIGNSQTSGTNQNPVSWLLLSIPDQQLPSLDSSDPGPRCPPPRSCCPATFASIDLICLAPVNEQGLTHR